MELRQETTTEAGGRCQACPPEFHIRTVHVLYVGGERCARFCTAHMICLRDLLNREAYKSSPAFQEANTNHKRRKVYVPQR